MRTLLHAALLSIPLAAWSRSEGPRPLEARGFAFELSVTVPAEPRAAFDAFTGDVSGWWDHTFSEHPASLVLEPRPGGAFLERFDESGDGARHAEVTYVKRGEELQFVGPLGLAGVGANIQLHHRVRFAAAEGEGTRVALSVRAIGEVEDGWPAAVEGVWRHFLLERYAPYVSGTLQGDDR